MKERNKTYGYGEGNKDKERNKSVPMLLINGESCPNYLYFSLLATVVVSSEELPTFSSFFQKQIENNNYIINVYMSYEIKVVRIHSCIE